MFDLIYNFLKDILFNSSVLTESQQQNACLLITCVCMVLIVFVLIKLIKWCFDIVGNKNKLRKY